MDFSPQLQLLASLIIGILVAAGSVYKFFMDIRRAPDPPETTTTRVIGAALNDSMALNEIANELREMRSFLQIQVVANRDGDHTAAIVKALYDVADAMRRPTARR